MECGGLPPLCYAPACRGDGARAFLEEGSVLAVYPRVRETRFCELGNGSHIPHDFAFSFIIHLTPGKQHNRRFPQASMSHAFSIRRLRVSGCFAVRIEKIQSRRAIGVMSSHPTRASGAAASALRRSIGTLISGSSPARVISTVNVSPASAPAALRMVVLTLRQCLPLPFGSRAARKGKLLIAPSTIVLPRGGSLALAFLGRITVHDPVFSFVSGRNNLAQKRIVDLVFCNLVSVIRNFLMRFAAHRQHGLSAIFIPVGRFARLLSNPPTCFLRRPKSYIGHTSMNYLICFLLRFAIVRGSLAMLAVRGERFWASARQRPRRPDSSELPSPLLYLPGSVVSRYGRILVLNAKGEVSAHPYTDRE
jgi:hypothetical protein